MQAPRCSMNADVYYRASSGDVSCQDVVNSQPAAFTLLGGINLMWLCGRGAMPKGRQATIGQVQFRFMIPALLHVLIVQSKQFPQLLVLYAMYLQARKAVEPRYKLPAGCWMGNDAVLVGCSLVCCSRISGRVRDVQAA